MLNDFRTAIFNACSTLGIGVYDYWVTDAVFPYCITPTVQTIDDNAKNIDCGEFIFDVHIFDKYNGKATVINYAEALRSAVYAASVADVNRSVSYLITNEKEPDIAHAVVSIRFKY